MASADSQSPDESFFNDLSQQITDNATANDQDTNNDNASKVKRIACVLCRKRKLRCDGLRPTCSTCKRLSHDCAYDEVRKKSGPKRGYVKLLEQRLQQVETLLKNQDGSDQGKEGARPDTASAYVANTLSQGAPISNEFLTVQGDTHVRRESGGSGAYPFQEFGGGNHNSGPEVSWEMIGLGLEEPLPPQDVMDELYQIYFCKIHPSLPIVHRPRFMAALNLAPHMRPPICLRYIMWTMAASVTDKYEALQEHFYQRARKYAQMDEMRGHGESTITLSHCQSWILTCTYEFKQMYFPRAWLSAGRAVRLAQMMQLHRLDGVGLDVKQCLPPPKDWTEREERRRTFWLSFCIDRYASIGTGWPMTIDERDIMTNLPASEEAFEKSKPMPTGTLDQVLNPNGATNLQALGAIVLTAAMFGRNLLHLHRPTPEDHDDDINGGFWKRHRQIEQILLQTSLGLPDSLRLPSGLTDPNVVFANMCIHTSAICLHQAAIFKADKYRMPANVSNESKIRCVTAAAEIASIMRMISHMDLGAMNPFISFCVYVAARVFVQYLKTRPSDQQMTSSLQFLLQAMQALRRKNPLTESFLVQLDLDLESAGIPGLQKPYLPPSSQVSQHPRSMQGLSDAVGNRVAHAHALNSGTDPIFEIRDTQDPSATINTFGNGNPIPNAQTSSTQYSNRNPGPPFHVTNVNSINLSTHSASFMSARTSSNGGIGQDTPLRGQDYPPANFAFLDGSDMDISGDRMNDHPSPATVSSQSRGGSTSQSSYSPGNFNEQHLPYRASPKMPTGSVSGATMGSATVFQNYGANTDMFSNAFSATGEPADSMYNQGFVVGSDWEYSAMTSGTGMTPMNDVSWDSMLESVTMGWDTIGPPRDHQQGHSSGVS